MSKGLKRSLVGHGILLLLLAFGLPSLFKKEPEPVNMVMVELVPISQLTNVPKAAEPEKPKEPEKQPAPPPPAPKAPPPPPEPEEPKPTPPEPPKAPEPEKLEPKPEEKPEEKPKPVEKKPEPPKPAPPKKPQEKPKKKEDKLDFDSVLKTVEKIEKKQEKSEETKEKPQDSAPIKSRADTAFNAEQALSVTEMDAIRQQVSRNWSMPAGAKDAGNLRVDLRLRLEKDGTVTDVQIVDRSRYSSDTFYRAAADSAMRAVLKASPFRGLPPEKYDTWQSIIMGFDPKDMIY